MRHKFSLLGFILIFFNALACSQHNFDSIKICHSNRHLSDVLVGEYKVEISDARLLSFFSKDSAIAYEVRAKTFFLKNLFKKSVLELQLLDNGVSIRADDTSFILNSPKSINLPDTEGEVQALYSLGDFSFSLEFKKNKIDRILFPTTGKFMIIKLINLYGAYSWDFLIESEQHKNQLLMSYVNKEPYSLSIQNDKNKIGVRLLSEKKNGRITLLQGLKLYESDSFMSDKSYWLKYANNGKMIKHSGFEITCQK